MHSHLFTSMFDVIVFNWLLYFCAPNKEVGHRAFWSLSLASMTLFFPVIFIPEAGINTSAWIFSTWMLRIGTLFTAMPLLAKNLQSIWFAAVDTIFIVVVAANLSYLSTCISFF